MVILDLNPPRQAQNVYSSPLITQERNNNEIANLNEGNAIQHETPIQSFYAGQCVFITGGTGFLGKILIEKLLRSCPNLSKIYLLVRSKKGKNVENRIEELFSDLIFQRLKEEMPKFRHKVFGFAGDCSTQGLGLSSADRDVIVRDVSIVFHVAATVRFEEKLKLATAINIRSTSEIIELCKNMQKLKSVIHVSTAYANCYESTISEKFYNYPIKHEAVLKLVECLPENIIDEITPRIIKPWPNTYTFTKAIAEDLIREKNKGLPMGIFRPAIVISTDKEPIPGWVNNLYGPTAVVTGAASGILRTIVCNPKLQTSMVPVDLTVNALISSAWDVATQFNKRDEEMLIYNYVSSVDAPITWEEFRTINMRHSRQYPMNNSMWYVMLQLNKSKFLHSISVIFLHLFPALLVDNINRCMGKKPRLMKIYDKINNLSNAFSHFTLREWNFVNNNVNDMWSRLDSQDQDLYPFTMKGFDWNKYFQSYIKGIRLYILKDDLSTLKQSRIRQSRFYILHQSLKMLMITLGFWFLWNILCKFVIHP